MRFRTFFTTAAVAITAAVLQVPAAQAAPTDLVDCAGGGAMPFSISTLSAPRNAEQGTSSESVALRNFLQTHPLGRQFPQSGWFVLATKTVDANDYVRFGHGTLTNFRNLLFMRVAGREWNWHTSYGQNCVLRTMITPTRASTAWNIDPKRLPLNRRSRVVWIQMSEEACASGRAADGRAHVPVIQYGPTAITMIATIEPQGGTQTCQGNPPTYVRVLLSQPIGSRALIDGGSVPANSRLSRKQLKRIRQRRNATSVLLFTRSQDEICHDVADDALTIEGLTINTKQRARLNVLQSRCID